MHIQSKIFNIEIIHAYVGLCMHGNFIQSKTESQYEWTLFKMVDSFK